MMYQARIAVFWTNCKKSEWWKNSQIFTLCIRSSRRGSPQCGRTRNILNEKIFREVNSSVTSLEKHWFHEKVWERISVNSTLWKLTFQWEGRMFFSNIGFWQFLANAYFFSLIAIVWKIQKFTLTLLWQNFRESTVFSAKVSEKLSSQNIFSMREFLAFSHCGE